MCTKHSLLIPIYLILHSPQVPTCGFSNYLNHTKLTAMIHKAKKWLLKINFHKTYSSNSTSTDIEQKKITSRISNVTDKFILPITQYLQTQSIQNCSPQFHIHIKLLNMELLLRLFLHTLKTINYEQNSRAFLQLGTISTAPSTLYLSPTVSHSKSTYIITSQPSHISDKHRLNQLHHIV